MPRLMPIRGLRYTASAGALDQLLAPPFDVIGERERERLAELSPHNAVRLEAAGKEYQAIAAELERWEAEGIVERDAAPMLYVYEQVFVEEGVERKRRALICGVESQPWEEGAVLPHEFTMSAPKEDRLRLLQATGTQFSPIFMLARDRSGQLAELLAGTAERGEPDTSGVTADGVTHRLWVLPADRAALRPLAPLLSEAFYIADGHHRYETSVAYRTWLAEQQGTLASDHPARFAMAGVVPVEDEGLVVRPLHRFVPREAPGDWRARLEPLFDVEEASVAIEPGALEALRAASPEAIVAVNLAPGAVYLLRPKSEDAVARLAPAGASPRWASAAPILLRLGVLDPLWGISDEDLRAGAVTFTHEVAEVVEALGGGGTGFLLQHVPASEVITLADGGERLPQKSTFYYPKLGTGLVFAPLSA
ncbi:MAG: DUF1015 domain-containing protein [Dehalococcoidia bacterium]|nr:DUF1015 domain-containing protein [Dehalococcoidia bacterium]